MISRCGFLFFHFFEIAHLEAFVFDFVNILLLLDSSPLLFSLLLLLFVLLHVDQEVIVGKFVRRVRLLFFFLCSSAGLSGNLSGFN